MKNKIMLWIRLPSLRLFITVIIMIGVDLIVLSSHVTLDYRQSSLEALIATSIIFAITAGLILAIINNFVKGLRDQFIEQARRVRQLAWECYDNFVKVDNQEFRTFFSKHILPLAEKGLREWSEMENIQNWGKDIEKGLIKLIKMDNHAPGIYEFLYRYLLPLEDELNILGLLYIKRVLVLRHATTATGVYYLLCFAVVVITLGKVLPATPTFNLLVLNGAIAVITYAILELLFVLSFTLQEVREEYIETDKFRYRKEKEDKDND